MGVHDGHRQRLKSRFAEYGLTGMDDHNALEMLLFYALPRRDTNELAHNLINHFGSLADVLEADVRELMQADGIGENAAVLISLVTQMNKRYMELRSIEAPIIDSTSSAGKYFAAKFAYETKEIACAMFLDSKNCIISCREISKGVVNGTELNIRSLVEAALKYNAVSVIISHNHPRGVAAPSAEDEYSTRKIKQALDLVGIRLLDHIIVAGERYQSLADLGLV